MRIDAALAAPDQWERDLTELLGLDGAGAADVSRPARPARALLLAVMLVTLAVIGLGSVVVWRDRASPVPAGPASVVRVLAERPRPAPAIAIIPAPLPIAQEGLTRNAAPVASTNRVGSRTESAAGGASPAARLAPRAMSANRSGTGPARFGARAKPIMADRGVAMRDTARREASRPPTWSSPPARDIIGPSSADPRRSNEGDRTVAAIHDQPSSLIRSALPPSRQAIDDRQAPLPPALRARPEEKKSHIGKTEAIDAIRLLRRQ